MPPTICTGTLAGNGEIVALVVPPLETVDKKDHLRRVTVEQADVGRIEPRSTQRRNHHSAIASRRNAWHARLMRSGGFPVLEPDAFHLAPRCVDLARCVEPYDTGAG